jgi:hypothetical protein
MNVLSEVTCALSRLNEAEHVRQEYIEAGRLRQEQLRAEAEMAVVDEAVSQVESALEMLPKQELIAPKLLAPRQPEPMRVHVEVVVRFERGDKEQLPNQ